MAQRKLSATKLHLQGDWYIEQLTPAEIHGHRVKRRLVSLQTPFQKVEIVDTQDYGRCLFLDGLVQSTEADEFIYHESLIHPGLILHPRPQKIFIAGGGEGAPLREILKHLSVETVTMVEIDREIVRLAERYLGAWHTGAFHDPRVTLYYEDARAFLQKNEGCYDVIILDLCDPGEAGPARNLFTVECYKLIRRRLCSSGIVAVQAGSANVNMLRGCSSVYQSLKKVFPCVLPYESCVPSYVGPWAFFLAGNSLTPRYKDEKIIDQKIKERNLQDRLRFYSPQVHRSLFCLPPYFYTSLRKGKAVSDRTPLLLKRHPE